MSKLGEQWEKNLRDVQLFADKFGYLPGKKDNRRLGRWIANQRYQLRRNLMGKTKTAEPSKFATMKAEKLRLIGIDVTEYNPTASLTKEQKGQPTWSDVIEYRLNNDDDDESDDLMLHNYYLTLMRPAFKRPEEFKSLADFLVRCFQVDNIDPRECLPSCENYTMRYVLSYITVPYQPRTIHTRTKSLITTGDSSYFGSDQLQGSAVWEKMQLVEGTLPKWMGDMYRGTFKSKPPHNDLIELTKNERRWFDHYPISKNGTNPYKGIWPDVCGTTNPGPRRLALFAEVDGPKYNKRYKCHIEEGYGYSYSFLPNCFMGGRCLRDYPEVADMGIEAWRHVYHYLTPISQQSPPNSCNVLTYFGDFTGTIRAHRDNSPQMQLDPQENSQILGTSVMVVNFYHTQEVQFLSTGDNTGKSVVDCFQLEHFSIYTMNCWDDVLYYHRCTFRDELKGKIRVSFIYRWLGRRCEFFCQDYGGRRQCCEVWQADQAMQKRYPNCDFARKMYGLQRKDMLYDTSIFPPAKVTRSNRTRGSSN